ncbi:hypothetical protein BV22DRAFT_841615 [Leucogyrophana mollusca]|uniref:Uncharacterized protein n=1 Tax=Leucogyrophana mollusca TaxID=85980 RepID=A0ACB8B423_9AGAM|nr:hypothetical protein BV22DRAFT_841615 [Leucogyrophana mollusca]
MSEAHIFIACSVWLIQSIGGRSQIDYYLVQVALDRRRSQTLLPFAEKLAVAAISCEFAQKPAPACAGCSTVNTAHKNML